MHRLDGRRSGRCSCALGCRGTRECIFKLGLGAADRITQHSLACLELAPELGGCTSFRGRVRLHLAGHDLRIGFYRVGAHDCRLQPDLCLSACLRLARSDCTSTCGRALQLSHLILRGRRPCDRFFERHIFSSARFGVRGRGPSLGRGSCECRCESSCCVWWQLAWRQLEQ